MSNDLLNINIQEIEVITGTIRFDEYEIIKQQALELAENIAQVEVTDENIQTSKKLLAAVNNRVKEMESKRIAIKKEMLEPYNEFEQQVKEIVNIVKDADNIVRNQIRELEEQDREEKRGVIAALFEKRVKQYSFTGAFGFEQFLKPQHLNKSTSLKSVEVELVEWLEKIDADLQAIASLPDSDAILTEYYDTKDVATAIRIVNDRKALQQQIKKAVEPVKNNESQTYNITIFSDTDLMIIEMFLELKNIKYKVEKAG